MSLYDECLEKLANRSEAAKQRMQKKRERNSTIAGTAIVGAGFLASRGSLDRLMGYHTVYHGTSKDATAIRNSGIKKSKGGTGVSIIDDAYKNGGSSNHVERSKGHVYVSKRRANALHYTIGNNFFPNDSKVIKARIPHAHWNKAKVDDLTKKLVVDSGVKIPDKLHLQNAAMLPNSISPARIVGSNKYKGIKQYATAKNMKSYLTSKGGTKRFLGGVMQAGASAALIAKGHSMTRKKEG